MKKTILAVLLAAAAAPALAQTYVHGHVRKDGTYVAPHHRTSADGNAYNNYSTRGNVNLYTGQAGTVSPSPQVQFIPAPSTPVYPSNSSLYVPPQQYQSRASGYR